ncbi:MAG: hypothetical protein IPN76_34560 [Saprospiraceae bacterium]|nr:hypothetical protein [Saprospiraceae bacterium]
MKNLKFAAFALIAILVTNCNSDDDTKLADCPNCNFDCIAAGESDVSTNDCPSNWDCHYNLKENSTIEYSNDEYHGSAAVKAGANLVFELTLGTEGSPMVIDDEQTKSLYFEIEASHESFSVEGDDLDLLNIRYQVSCYCADTRFKEPVSGCVQGQKIDGNQWRVQGSLEIPYSIENTSFNFDAVFSK